MNSPVLDLQRLATNRENDIVDLLRKAKLVAAKLKLDSFRTWIDHELKGYDAVDVPEYRKLRAVLQAKNPYHGLVPVIVRGKWLADSLCNVEIKDPLSNLATLVEKNRAHDGPLMIPLTHQQMTALIDAQGFGALVPIRTVQPNQIEVIIESVRTSILEWALKLEEQGILGEGVQFTDDEKRRATTHPQIKIEHFQGILGNVSHSTVDQNLQMDVRNNDFESLKRFLEAQKVSDEDINELEVALRTDPKPKDGAVFGARVAAWIGKMATKAASGVWQATVSTSSALLTAAIRAYYGF